MVETVTHYSSTKTTLRSSGHSVAVLVVHCLGLSTSDECIGSIYDHICKSGAVEVATSIFVIVFVRRMNCVESRNVAEKVECWKNL